MASVAESAGSASGGASQCVPDKSTIAQCFPDKALAQAIASQLKGDKGRTGEVLTSKDVKDTTAFPLSWLSLLEFSAGISSVQGLQVFTNLTYLDLCGTRVSDVSPLSKLTNLRGLNLCGTRVSDVSPLSKLVNLDYLDLWGTGVSDVSPLSKLHLASSSNSTARNVRPSVKLTVNADGSVSLPAPRWTDGMFVAPSSTSPAGGVLDAKRGVVTWKGYVTRKRRTPTTSTVVACSPAM